MYKHKNPFNYTQSACYASYASHASGVGENEDFACPETPCVTPVSSECCVNHAVRLARVGGWLEVLLLVLVFSWFVRNWFFSRFSPSSSPAGKVSLWGEPQPPPPQNKKTTMF